MVVYVDGQNKDGTEHYANKLGEYIGQNMNFIELLSRSRKVMIPVHRIIRIEEDKTMKMEKMEKEHKWRY